MPSIEHVLYVGLIFLMSGCMPTSSTMPDSGDITETSTVAVQPSKIPPTSENRPALEAGQWTYIFYHEELQQVTLVNGGPEQGKPAGEPLELWGWDGTQWSLILADENGPGWRNWPAVAYDSARDVLVIHGGLQNGTNFDETWEWDGQTWTRFTGSGPGARRGADDV